LLPWRRKPFAHLGQPPRDLVVQREHALVDQAKQRRRGDHLGDRTGAEDGIRIGLPSRTFAESGLPDRLAAADHRDDEARVALGGDEGADHALQVRGLRGVEGRRPLGARWRRRRRGAGGEQGGYGDDGRAWIHGASRGGSDAPYHRASALRRRASTRRREGGSDEAELVGVGLQEGGVVVFHGVEAAGDGRGDEGAIGDGAGGELAGEPGFDLVFGQHHRHAIVDGGDLLVGGGGENDEAGVPAAFFGRLVDAGQGDQTSFTTCEAQRSPV